MLHDTGPGDVEESSGQRLAAFGLFPEADFSPLDRWTYSPLSGVVGGFYSLMIQEGEQVVRMLEEPSGSTCHIVIRGQLKGLKTDADASPYGHRFSHSGMAVRFRTPSYSDPDAPNCVRMQRTLTPYLSPLQESMS